MIDHRCIDSAAVVYGVHWSSRKLISCKRKRFVVAEK